MSLSKNRFTVKSTEDITNMKLVKSRKATLNAYNVHVNLFLELLWKI